MKPYQTIPRRAIGILLGGLLVLSHNGEALPPDTPVTNHMVNTLADPGTNGCTPEECTLREVLAQAQDGDTITFAPALFTAGPQTLRLRAGALVLDKHLTLRGPGQDVLTISGRQASAVLQIPPAAVVLLTQLALTRGLAAPAGGIDNAGTLTLTHTTVSGHTGSGIMNRVTGSLTLRHSTLRGNTFTGLENAGRARLSHSTIHGNARGLANLQGGVLTLRHSTVSGHAITGLMNGGMATLIHTTISGNGTGIVNDRTGLVTLRQSTLTTNTVTGLFNAGALRLHATVIAGNVDAHPPPPIAPGSGPSATTGLISRAWGRDVPRTPGAAT